MRLSASRRGRAGGQGEARPIRLTPEGRANPAPFRPLGETDDLGAMQSAGRGIEPRPAQSLLSVCRGILAWVRASFQGSAVPPICCANRLPHRPLTRPPRGPLQPAPVPMPGVARQDRKSDVSGKGGSGRVYLGGRGRIKKKKKK